MSSFVEPFEDDLDDAFPAPTAWELGIPLDRVKEEVEDDDEDGLGFRGLLERPEDLLADEIAIAMVNED
jgi:hypothetical protein